MQTTWTVADTTYGTLTITDDPQRDNYQSTTAWYAYATDAAGQTYLVRWDDLGDTDDDSADAADWQHPAEVLPQ